MRELRRQGIVPLDKFGEVDRRQLPVAHDDAASFVAASSDIDPDDDPVTIIKKIAYSDAAAVTEIHICPGNLFLTIPSLPYP